MVQPVYSSDKDIILIAGGIEWTSRQNRASATKTNQMQSDFDAPWDDTDLYSCKQNITL